MALQLSTGSGRPTCHGDKQPCPISSSHARDTPASCGSWEPGPLSSASSGQSHRVWFELMAAVATYLPVYHTLLLSWSFKLSYVEINMLSTNLLFDCKSPKASLFISAQDPAALKRGCHCHIEWPCTLRNSMTLRAVIALAMFKKGIHYVILKWEIMLERARALKELKTGLPAFWGSNTCFQQWVPAGSCRMKVSSPLDVCAWVYDNGYMSQAMYYRRQDGLTRRQHSL